MVPGVKRKDPVSAARPLGVDAGRVTAFAGPIVGPSPVLSNRVATRA
jgi:hypothetical protein